MKFIKDSVHDYIKISDVALSILDTPILQRLRRVSQLGTTSLVYPSANHTRFEHSLGVYHLANLAVRHLDVSNDTAEHLRAAALLHDIGHTPYSHNIEPIVERRTGLSHIDVTSLLEEGQIAKTLQANNLDIGWISNLIAGKGEFGGLISGELDIDRMDYLVRDAHHTGVPYGIIDHERLIRELTLIDGDIVLRENNVQSAEALLIARSLMYPTVYNHHVGRIATSMLRRATEKLLDTGSVDPIQLRSMDDHDLFAALRSNSKTYELVNRLGNRDLYKRSVWAERQVVPDDLVGKSHRNIRDAENRVADAAGVKPEYVILDIPPEPKMKETTTKVVVGGEVRRLEEQSALVEALRSAQYAQWRFGVYSTPELVEKVGEAAERTLGLDTDGDLISSRNGRTVRTDKFLG